MPTKPRKKSVQKPKKRGKASIDKIAEKDLKIPAEDLRKVKGGMLAKKPKKKPLRPPLVPIPT